jgi:hypothetical protein
MRWSWRRAREEIPIVYAIRIIADLLAFAVGQEEDDIPSPVVRVAENADMINSA